MHSNPSDTPDPTLTPNPTHKNEIRHVFLRCRNLLWLFIHCGFAAVVMLMMTAQVSPAETSETKDPKPFRTGTEFTRQLNRPLLVQRDFSPLKTVLERLSQDRRITILMDRRINPDRLVRVDLQAPFFDTGIATLVENIPASAVVAGDAIFVTLPETARTLRTRIALAEKQFEELPQKGLSRQLELSRKITLQWNQLASPRDILTEFAARFDVEISNPEFIPYDLWRAGTIPTANFCTGAQILASQYDLDLHWVTPHQIQLIPQNPNPLLPQEHFHRGRTREKAVALVTEKLPHLLIQPGRDRLQLLGTVEQHEELAVVLGNRPARKAAAPVVATSLANRRFTLRMMNRPFSELLTVLEKQGIQFERHEQLLADAEIDLSKPISLELQEATIEKLLTDACTPLGLTFQIDGTQVELHPASTPPKQ